MYLRAYLRCLTAVQDGWSVLHAASYGGDVRIMALLVERGADVHKVTKVRCYPMAACLLVA
jgi:hypothetical protein